MSHYIYLFLCTFTNFKFSLIDTDIIPLCLSSFSSMTFHSLFQYHHKKKPFCEIQYRHM